MSDSNHAHSGRRRFVQAAGGLLGSALVGSLGSNALAQTLTKRFAGTALNVSCWSSPYAKWLADYLPDFEQQSGIHVNYDTPAAPVYNQRADLELSTKGSSYDVLNITFIYVSRWINAGWFTPLDDLVRDRNKTPADWGPEDFLPVAVDSMKDRAGRLYGFPWLTETVMATASRFDLFRQAGRGMPDTFDELMATMRAVNGKDGVRGFVTENNYGWTFIPYLQGCGGNVFRNPPDDLMPTLDSPEAIAAADYFSQLIKLYSPDGALSYNYDAANNALMQGRANYSTMGHIYLTRLAEKGSKVAKTVAYSICPKGPAGRFPGVASHAWGIPVGAKNKDAAWEFIKWAVSKQMAQRMLVEKGYGALPRRSVIDSPHYKAAMTLNGFDLADIYTRTVAAAASGYMKYRTVHVFPQLNGQIAKAIEVIVSGQATPAAAMKQAQENSIAELRRAGVAL